MTNPIYSKTYWGNIVTALVFYIGVQFGYQVTPAEVAVVMAAINLILRTVTKEPIDWGGATP